MSIELLTVNRPMGINNGTVEITVDVDGQFDAEKLVELINSQLLVIAGSSRQWAITHACDALYDVTDLMPMNQLEELNDCILKVCVSLNLRSKIVVKLI
ncbi:hypothetical protein [Enterovibrio calviensis]|uniref:hypothetical protein n=1 Tax=Enterovibrio calviensis TaxID=91359 RepID=UPI0004876C30|nr:hypothetical protein [Enterovibrio calviensis]